MRRLPHDPRPPGRGRSRRAEPDPPPEPEPLRRRHLRTQPDEPPQVAAEPAGPEADEPGERAGHAEPRPVRGRDHPAHRLPGDAQVMAIVVDRPSGGAEVPATPASNGTGTNGKAAVPLLKRPQSMH